MAMIFISHSSRDKAFVLQLAKDLKLLGHSPWVDHFEIQAGDSIPGKIADGLSAADFLLLVLSKSAVESGWVKEEWEPAYWEQVNERRIRVLPVLRNKCQIPHLLKSKRYADFQQSYAVGFAQLVQAIERPLGPDLDPELLDRRVNSCIESLCRAVSLPKSPANLRLRVFVFQIERSELVCRYYWSQNAVTEKVEQTRFALTSATAKEVAVVRAALKKKTCRTPVRPLPQDAPGVIGDVEDDLTFVLACPIFKSDGTIWGTVDFDTSTKVGTKLLCTDDANAVIFRMAKHLETILT